MKFGLRIFLILFSIAVLVYSLLPKSKTSGNSFEEEDLLRMEEAPIPEPISKPIPVPVPEPTSAPTPVPTLSAPQEAVRQALGGNAIDSGKRAQERINKINQERNSMFEEVGAGEE